MTETQSDTTQSAIATHMEEFRNAQERAWEARKAEERTQLSPWLDGKHLFEVCTTVTFNLPHPVPLPSREVMVYAVTAEITRFPNGDGEGDREGYTDVRARVRDLNANGTVSKRGDAHTISLAATDMAPLMLATGMLR